MTKYKIEGWDAEGGGRVYVAFARVRGWFGCYRWIEIGRGSNIGEAELICGDREKPQDGPWYYTAEAFRGSR